MHIYTFPPYRDTLDEFMDLYAVEHFVMCTPAPPVPRPRLKPPSERQCRFCGRTRPATTFRKKAHLLPQLIGNKYLLSDSECDACNVLFSGYENDLANFLGIGRTLHGLQGKEGIPTFKSADKLLTARAAELLGIKDGIRIERQRLDNDAIKVLEGEGRAEVTALKQPYVPARVYKAFLKMALSLLPAHHVADFDLARYLVLSSTMDEDLGRFFWLVHYQLPATHNLRHPHCFIFQKRDPSGTHVSHQFYLRYQNHVYTLPIPLNRQDVELGLYSDEILTMVSPPLLFSLPAPDVGLCQREDKDLSGREPVRESETTFITYQPNAFRHLQAYDRETGLPVAGEFNPAEVTGIFIAPEEAIRQANTPQGKD